MSGAVVGVDVGGTFTDLILMEPETGAVRLAKVPSTPANQAAGVLAALDGARRPPSKRSRPSSTAPRSPPTRCWNASSAAAGSSPPGASATSWSSAGARGPGLTGSPAASRRSSRASFASRCRSAWTPPARFWCRWTRRRCGTRWTVAASGAGCDALVIHFLHSYKNPTHEERAVAIARENWREGYVTAGHAILAEFREFERGVAAAVNACVQPLLHRYLDRLAGAGSQSRGYERELLVIQGNGGSVSARSAAAKAVNTVLSGPASGVMAAAAIGRAAGARAISSPSIPAAPAPTWASCSDGVPAVTAEMELGARHADPRPHGGRAHGGRRRGLASRGSTTPGCFRWGRRARAPSRGRSATAGAGRGPRSTDANLILGRLDPDIPAGGREPGRARRLCARRSPRPSAPPSASTPKLRRQRSSASPTTAWPARSA